VGVVGLSQSPRWSTRVSRGSSRAMSVSVVDPAGHCCHSASIRSFASFHSATVVRQ
jgi:hypothetical protein